MVQTNFFNLGNEKGMGYYVADQAYPGSTFKMDWDVKCPAVSAVPAIGVDIHLFSTLSLTFDADYRFGLGGHNRYTVTYTDGPIASQTCHHKNTWERPNVSIGLKFDFPTRPISQGAWNNLWMLLYSWIEDHAGR